MKIKTPIITFLLFLIIPTYIFAQSDPIDLEMVYKIKSEGKSNSKIEELFVGINATVPSIFSFCIAKKICPPLLIIYFSILLKLIQAA